MLVNALGLALRWIFFLLLDVLVYKFLQATNCHFRTNFILQSPYVFVEIQNKALRSLADAFVGTVGAILNFIHTIGC